jgi:hypothetical protein
VLQFFQRKYKETFFIAIAMHVYDIDGDAPYAKEIDFRVFLTKIRGSL